MKVAVTFKRLNESNARKLEPYLAALRAVDLDPVAVTPEEPRALDGFRGLVLTGGSDINPARYGEALNGSERVDDERDRLETDRLGEAIQKDLPVLAICRGVQLLNVFHGGSLIQDLPTKQIHEKRSNDWQPGRHPAAHSVKVNGCSRLAAIVGAGAHEVNSRHHQAASRVGGKLNVTAVSSDGVIEGLERPDRSFVIGVQWHPEDRLCVSEADLKLFRAFAAACSR
jgi:putative glutamine amidotransferase